MTTHYNRRSEKVNRRELRQSSTQAEKILWQHLKNRNLMGLKFRRQYSVDQFVLDFYCPEIKLAIELDGKIHLDKKVKNHDENRDGFIKGFGIKIIRIGNDLILEDIQQVLELIEKEINKVRESNSACG